MKYRKLTTLVVFSSIIGTTFLNSATPVFAHIVSDKGIPTTTHYDFKEIMYDLSHGYAFIPDKALKKYANIFLCNNDYNADIPIENAEKLERLGIDNTSGIKDFRGINQFKNLKVLSYSYLTGEESPKDDLGDNIKNLNEIGQLSNLKWLTFESNVTNLNFLRKNTSIERLLVKSNKLNDLSELFNLSNLEWVILKDIPYTQYNDSMLKDLKELHPDMKIEVSWG